MGAYFYTVVAQPARTNENSLYYIHFISELCVCEAEYRRCARRSTPRARTWTRIFRKKRETAQLLVYGLHIKYIYNNVVRWTAALRPQLLPFHSIPTHEMHAHMWCVYFCSNRIEYETKCVAHCSTGHGYWGESPFGRQMNAKQQANNKCYSRLW